MTQLTTKLFAFVLMPFERAFDDVYQMGIKDACLDAGMYCERIDKQIFEERILERIYNQMAKADVIIADMTGRDPNVFYEVGYAHALGKRVILITQNEEDIPFDLKLFYHIVYGGRIAELKEKLRQRMAWSVEHPQDTAFEQVEQIQFFIQGIPLTDELIVPVQLEHKSFLQEKNIEYTALPIEFMANNPAGKRVQSASFTPILLSPAFCERCAMMISPNSSVEYQTLKLPDGRLLHRPPKSCHIESGGWDEVLFNLWVKIEDGIKLNHPYDFTLRILTDGPARDFDFKVKMINF